MTRSLVFAGVLACAAAANAAEVVNVPPWELHNSFWMSLHQTLIADAMRSTPRPLPDLTGDEQTAWNQAVGAYRTAGGRGDMTFARPMLITTDGLTQVADEAVDPLLDVPLRDALMAAAPIYRRRWWTADAQANGFFIGYAAAMMRDAGAALVRAHEAVYRAKWPDRVRVYIAPSGGPFGAYTVVGRSGGVITTMSSRDAGYSGLRVIEMLLHESSHAIVNPTNGPVAAAIAASAKKHGVEAPRDLWHAIIFATSGELTRRALLTRGVPDYVPSSIDLFTRVWPGYRGPVEKSWFSYLDGHGTLEDAIDEVVGAIAR
jgi:hypothetical protein